MPAEKLIGEIISRVLSVQPHHFVIAIGGPGGTGKSTFAKRLAQTLSESVILTLDDYKTPRLDRQQANVFGPHPAANRIELITSHITDLRNGKSISKPVYDRVSGSATSTETIDPARWIIVDGEVSTYACFRNLIDFSIFIDSDWRTQLATRLGRDLGNRGYSPDKAVATFLHSNLREFAEHGASSKQWADVHLFCSSDYRLTLESVSVPVYERISRFIDSEVEPVNTAGLIVPMLTPFNRQGGIERQAFAEHVDYLKTAGVTRILLCGTTGEFFSMSPDERIELAKLALEYFPGLIWFQAGGGPLSEAVKLAKEAEEIGVDGILCLPPAYYAAAPAEGIKTYLNAVQAATDIPLILYNFPLHTGNPVTPEILNSVTHFGLKDSEGSLDLIRHTPRYFTGSDALICKAMQEGAAGFISGLANVWPERYIAMEKAFLEHNPAEAEQIQVEINTRAAEVGSPQISSLKKHLAARLPGYPAFVRPPLTCTE